MKLGLMTAVLSPRGQSVPLRGTRRGERRAARPLLGVGLRGCSDDSVTSLVKKKKLRKNQDERIRSSIMDLLGLRPSCDTKRGY